MNIKLTIVSQDKDYAESISKVLSEDYTEEFEVSMYYLGDSRDYVTTGKLFDVVLTDQDAKQGELPTAKLYVGLADGTKLFEEKPNWVYIKKYQRISKTVSEILEKYANIAQDVGGLHVGKARMSAVWSPAGGSGKTMVAMAYATRLAMQGKQVIYLDMEFFSSTRTYFQDEAKSISRLFEALNGKTNMDILLTSLKKKDNATGVTYLGVPDNYDDMNILTVDDVKEVLAICSKQCDELVVDLSSCCDEKVKYILENADHMLAVIDSTTTSMVKWSQFRTQSNLFDKLKTKIVLIANKGAVYNGEDVKKVYQFPTIKTDDAIAVYKTLSAREFE